MIPKAHTGSRSSHGEWAFCRSTGRAGGKEHGN